MRKILVIILFALILGGCLGNNSDKTKVIVFHAGSLSLPMKEMERKYEALYPKIDIQLEGAGSVACARKISDLNRECDIMASADYKVIEEMLIPTYTSVNIKFASNSMAIAYTERSNRSKEINVDNWMDILMDEDVIYGRSDPNSDPCGYRSIMTMKLSEIFYSRDDITEKLIAKDQNMIRPKEVDLVALLETGALDYFFIYKSVALQHGFKFLELPAEIDLSDPGLNDLYSSVSVDIIGRSPGEFLTIKGSEMIYGITLLDSSPERKSAIDFLSFFLGEEGREIIESNGQSVLDLPDSLSNMISE